MAPPPAAPDAPDGPDAAPDRRVDEHKGTTGTRRERSRRTGPTRELDPDELAALEEERDFLLRSLRDLEREHDAGDVDDDDYEELKDDYTARAAAVLRSIERRETRLADTRSLRRRSPAVLAAVVAGVVALAVLAGVLVAQASGRRDAGDTLSGDSRQSTRDLLLRAQDQFGEGKLLDAIKTYDEVLKQQPANREALTYKGWLLYRVSVSAQGSGQVSADDVQVLQRRALASLDQAVAADPSYADARIFRAIIFRDLGRTADAAAELERAPADQVPEFLRAQVDQLRQQVAGAPTSTAPTSPAPAPSAR